MEQQWYPVWQQKKQVILINSSFFVHFSFSQNKGKEKKKNQPTPPAPYPTELKLDTYKVSQEAKTELTSVFRPLLLALPEERLIIEQ